MGSWFHTHDGWFWRRLDDGAVEIEVRADGKEDGEVIGRHVLPAAQWASVVSFVSAMGPTAETHQRAEQLHQDRGV